MLPQTQRVPWTFSVFTVLLCYVFLALINIQIVTAMSLDRLGLERKEIQQSSAINDAKIVINEEHNRLIVDEDRQLTPVLTPVDEIADMYVLSPAIDKNTIEFDINVPNGETDMLMVESNAVPSIETVHENSERATNIYKDSEIKEENSQNSKDIIKKGSIFENQSPSSFANLVNKDINDKETIISLTPPLVIAESNSEEKVLPLNDNSETSQIATHEINNTDNNNNVGEKMDTILDTVVDVLDDAMKQFETSDFSSNQQNENVTESVSQSNLSNNATDFQEIDKALPSEIEKTIINNSMSDKDVLFETNVELNDELKKEEEILVEKGNEEVLAFNKNKENENEPVQSDDLSESEITNITENIETIDENNKNDLLQSFITNPSEETSFEATTEQVNNFEDINIPENYEAQKDVEEATLFMQSLEHNNNEDIVVKLESYEIESGTIKTDSDMVENLAIAEEVVEINTEKNNEIESETETPNYIEEMPEKIISNIDDDDEVDSKDTTTKPYILNDNENVSEMLTLNQYEVNKDEVVKPPLQMSSLETEPSTAENINNDEIKQTTNVIDSILNYVNASFVQNNKQGLLEPLKDEQIEDENDFKPSLRSYEGAQVWRIFVQTDKDRKLADELLTKYDGQLWKEVNQEVDYLLKPQALYDAEKHISKANLSRIVLIDNLQSIIDVENPPAEEIAQLQNRKGHRLTWQAYHRLEDIHGFFDYLAKTYPDICTVETIGYSIEKRPLKILKISNGNVGNPGIWIDGGMHAREWISPAAVTYIANQIVEGWDDLPAYMKNVNWHIHAVANPDGYEYSHTTDRLWRKNMRAHGRDCPGVDLNRNFGYMWGGKGTSASPCSQIYRGSKAFSEPETFYISKYISNFPRGTFSGYLSFHSYGQYILYPWGYDYALTHDKADLDRVARQAGTAITKSTGGKYTVGTSATTLYPAAGGSDDWAKGFVGIKYSYTIEMGDTGRYGFILPAQFIEYNGKDAYTFAETVANSVIQEQVVRLRGF